MTSISTINKPFWIEKRRVYEAYKAVKSNHGAAGVDGQTLEIFEKDLAGNLYKIWNRMSSGTYFPPPVRAVSIPKKTGGERILGVPTVSDRIAQMVVKQMIEPDLEPIFLPDSYGYRPGKSALDAVGVTRQRCWKYGWVLEFDIKGLFDNLPHDLLLKARIDPPGFDAGKLIKGKKRHVLVDMQGCFYRRSSHRPTSRTVMAASRCCRLCSGCSHSSQNCLPTALTRGRNSMPRSSRFCRTSKQKSSDARTQPRALSLCPSDGSWRGRSDGSIAAADWPRIGKISTSAPSSSSASPQSASYSESSVINREDMGRTLRACASK